MSETKDFPFISERYKIIAQIGEGTWGTVYAAEDKLTDKIMAIKILTPTELAQKQMLERNLDPFKAVVAHRAFDKPKKRKFTEVRKKEL